MSDRIIPEAHSLRIPPPPYPGVTCEHCRHWLEKEGNNVTIMPDGGVHPTGELIRNGIKIPEGATNTRVSPCTLNPVWSQAPKQHWCGQFAPRETH